jgi:hypothetical protein
MAGKYERLTQTALQSSWLKYFVVQLLKYCCSEEKQESSFLQLLREWSKFHSTHCPQGSCQVCQQMSKIPHIHRTNWNHQKLSRSSNE